MPIKKMTRKFLEKHAVDYPEDVARPETRSDCMEVPRPCPFVGCKYHLYLDVKPDTGSIKYNFPDLEPHQLLDSCALDLIDQHQDLTLEYIGEIMNLTRERIRQIEEMTLDRCKDSEIDLEEFWKP